MIDLASTGTSPPQPTITACGQDRFSSRPSQTCARIFAHSEWPSRPTAGVVGSNRRSACRTEAFAQSTMRIFGRFRDCSRLALNPLRSSKRQSVPDDLAPPHRQGKGRLEVAREVARVSIRVTATTVFLLNTGHNWAVGAKVTKHLIAMGWTPPHLSASMCQTGHCTTS